MEPWQLSATEAARRIAAGVQFRHVVERIMKHRDRIWVTRPGDICAYIESLPPGIVPGSVVES